MTLLLVLNRVHVFFRFNRSRICSLKLRATKFRSGDLIFFTDNALIKLSSSKHFSHCGVVLRLPAAGLDEVFLLEIWPESKEFKFSYLYHRLASSRGDVFVRKINQAFKVSESVTNFLQRSRRARYSHVNYLKMLCRSLVEEFNFAFFPLLPNPTDSFCCSSFVLHFLISAGVTKQEAMKEVSVLPWHLAEGKLLDQYAAPPFSYSALCHLEKPKPLIAVREARRRKGSEK